MGAADLSLPVSVGDDLGRLWSHVAAVGWPRAELRVADHYPSCPGVPACLPGLGAYMYLLLPMEVVVLLPSRVEGLSVTSCGSRSIVWVRWGLSRDLGPRLCVLWMLQSSVPGWGGLKTCSPFAGWADGSSFCAQAPSACFPSAHSYPLRGHARPVRPLLLGASAPEELQGEGLCQRVLPEHHRSPCVHQPPRGARGR